MRVGARPHWSAALLTLTLLGCASSHQIIPISPDMAGSGTPTCTVRNGQLELMLEAGCKTRGKLEVTIRDDATGSVLMPGVTHDFLLEPGNPQLFRTRPGLMCIYPKAIEVELYDDCNPSGRADGTIRCEIVEVH